MSSLVVARMAIALAQAGVLFILYRTTVWKVWPATDGHVFAPMLAGAIFVPVVAIAGMANLRTRTIAIWLAALLVLCIGIAFFDIFQDPSVGGYNPVGLRIAPRQATWAGLAAIIFIVHSLISAGDTERRMIASYPRYHDVSWMLGVQHALSVAFVSIFWGLLWLGAELFRLIRIEQFAELIRHDWFYIPATTLSYAAAIHLTDARTGIVRGTRTLVLNLLSWLLPVLTLIVIAFLAALPFTGLEPLWNTRRATSILLTAAIALIVLINTAYQDGRSDSRRASVLSYALLVAVAGLTPLFALAAYGLGLRVDQYGWTASRVAVCATIAVVACYALGYALAALRDRRSLRGIEFTNIASSVLIVGVLLALLTPVASPARISVLDQVARLESGQIAPDKFDFVFLRFNSGRYGERALERLKSKTEGPGAAQISFKANEALDWKTPLQATRRTPATPAIGAEAVARNIAVIQPPGQALPDSFIRNNWSSETQKWNLPPCLTTIAQRCEAVLVDLDGDNVPEIVLFRLPSGQPATTFKVDGNGRWAILGVLGNSHCKDAREAVQMGKFELIAPPLKDIVANGVRMRVNANIIPNCRSTL
jgi:hypothetical protein